MRKVLVVACALAATAMAMSAAHAAPVSQVPIAEERTVPMPLADLQPAKADSMTVAYFSSGGGKLDVLVAEVPGPVPAGEQPKIATAAMLVRSRDAVAYPLLL